MLADRTDVNRSTHSRSRAVVQFLFFLGLSIGIWKYMDDRGCVAQRACQRLPGSADCRIIQRRILGGSCPYTRLVLPRSSVPVSASRVHMASADQAAQLDFSAVENLAILSAGNCNPALQAVAGNQNGSVTSSCVHVRPFPSSFEPLAAVSTTTVRSQGGADSLKELARRMQLPFFKENTSLVKTACGRWVDGVNKKGSLAFHDLAATRQAGRVLLQKQLAASPARNSNAARFVRACLRSARSTRPRLSYTLERVVAYHVLLEAMQKGVDAALSRLKGLDKKGTSRAIGMAEQGALLAYSCPVDIMVDLQRLCGEHVLLTSTTELQTDMELSWHSAALSPYLPPAKATEEASEQEWVEIQDEDVHSLFVGVAAAAAEVPASLGLRFGSVKIPFPSRRRMRGLAARCTDIHFANRRPQPPLCRVVDPRDSRYSPDGTPLPLHPSSSPVTEKLPWVSGVSTNFEDVELDDEKCEAAGVDTFLGDTAVSYFDMLVGRTTYSRIRGLFEQVQTAMQRMVQRDILGAFTSSQERQKASDMIADTTVRILGAPLDSWAGERSRSQPSNLFRLSTAKTGQVLMALEERRHEKMSRLQVGMHFHRPDTCSHAPLIDAGDTNAYYAPRLGCVVIAPGLFRRPLADQGYNDASLSSGIGFFLGHELAHSVLPLIADSFRRKLASVYGEARYVQEAAADVMALQMLSEMQGDISKDKVMLRFAQIFCTTSANVHGAQHPLGNARVNGAAHFFDTVGN